MNDRWSDLLKITQAVTQYAGGDTSRLYAQMLDALADVYRADLETVKTDDLVRVQTALRQVILLRDLINGSTDQPPKV